MKYGPGEYANAIEGIEYIGYWKLDTMWGYGVKTYREFPEQKES